MKLSFRVEFLKVVKYGTCDNWRNVLRYTLQLAIPKTSDNSFLRTGVVPSKYRKSIVFVLLFTRPCSVCLESVEISDCIASLRQILFFHKTRAKKVKGLSCEILPLNKYVFYLRQDHYFY
jgi:hypothetical protein